jgi:beta-xylosidase
VNTAYGEDWFLHFQDKEAYGRIVHLQPLQWKNDWPVIGEDPDGDGTGQPVIQYKIPRVKAPATTTAINGSDEFNAPRLNPHWQWSANPAEGWAFPTTQGTLRLFSRFTPDTLTNYWNLPYLLHQKFPAEAFSATLCLRFTARHKGEKTGLMVFGSDYAWLGLEKTASGLELIRVECRGADRSVPEEKQRLAILKTTKVWLRVTVDNEARCRFSWSEDGNQFTTLPETFSAKPGRWVGAVLGVFCVRENMTNDAGYADLDWFRIETGESKNTN